MVGSPNENDFGYSVIKKRRLKEKLLKEPCTYTMRGLTRAWSVFITNTCHICIKYFLLPI